MGARASSVRVTVLAAHAPFFPVMASGQLEVLKWIALASMLAAHWSRYVLGESGAVLVHVGSLAFPLYAFAVAAVLAADPVKRGQVMARGLFWFALAAQVGSMLVRPEPVLNVLYQFLAVAAWLGAERLQLQERWGVRALALAVAFLAEFAVFGFGFVVCLTRYLQRGRSVYLVGAGVAYLLLAFLEVDWFGLVAWPLIWCVAWAGWEAVQVRRLFPAAYVLQFPLWLLLRVLR